MPKELLPCSKWLAALARWGTEALRVYVVMSPRHCMCEPAQSIDCLKCNTAMGLAGIRGMPSLPSLRSQALLYPVTASPTCHAQAGADLRAGRDTVRSQVAGGVDEVSIQVLGN